MCFGDQLETESSQWLVLHSHIKTTPSFQQNNTDAERSLILVKQHYVRRWKNIIQRNYF